MLSSWFCRVLLVFASIGLMPVAHALSPYVRANPVTCSNLQDCVEGVENQVRQAGFQVLGKHYPRGLSQYAVLVITDKAWLQTIRSLGGSAIIGAGIRIGIKDDGSVSYINPEYWYRAYFQNKFESQRNAIKALDVRLGKALGNRGTFGGEVPAVDLPKYRYMIGMERFNSDKALLYSHPSFNTAVATVRQNLAKNLNHTSKVYEVVMPDLKLAVFGVGMNGPSSGEFHWVQQNGPEHIAVLPWEVYVVNGRVYALYARYRTALAWPGLGLGDFMRISDHPDTVQAMLIAVSGGRTLKFNAF